MNVQLSDTEIIYLYGRLKKELKKLETVKPKSLVSTDIRLYQSIIKSLEAAMPQLNMLPI